MGKNIILSEGQFKQYVKSMLISEGMRFNKPVANTPEITKDELKEKIEDWIDSGEECTMRELYLDQFANGYNIDIDTPMTYEEIENKYPGITPKFLINNAISKLVGPQGGKIAKRMKEQGKGFLLKKPDETAAEHKKRGVVGKEAKEEIDRKEGYEAQDKLFKDSLKDIIANGDPNGKLPHITLTPEDKNEEEYQKLSQTCYDNLIPFTENGEIYLPAKMNMQMVNKLTKDIKSPQFGVKPSVAIQKVPSKYLMNFLIQAGELTKITYLNKFIERGVLTQPKYHYVGLGGDNESGVVCMFYVPERDR